MKLINAASKFGAAFIIECGLSMKHLQVDKDKLTGFYRLILGESTAASKLREIAGQATCFIYADIDNMEQINNNLGLTKGDNFIANVTQEIAHLLPEKSTALRVGGDDFVIVLPDSSVQEALQIAEKIRLSIFNIAPIAYEKCQAISPSITLGIACLQTEETEPLSVIAKAQSANRRGKETGRNKVILAD